MPRTLISVFVHVKDLTFCIFAFPTILSHRIIAYWSNPPHFRLDIEKVANSKAWQRFIENDPLFYHGGYKFGPAQVHNIS